MIRPVRLLAAFLLLSAMAEGHGLGVTQAPRQTSTTPSSGSLKTADFPPSDILIYSAERRGLSAKEASARLVDAPDASETVALLLTHERVDDALAVVGRIVATQPGRIADAFAAISRSASMALRDQSRGYDGRIRDLIAAARARLPELPKEAAARLARQLLSADNLVTRGGSQGYEARIRQFVQDYAGTEEASLVEVDLMNSVTINLLRRIEALDTFARAHAGTLVGAKALYLEGFELANNVAITGVEPRGSDPTDRFMKVVGIARELESGSYPKSEWVDKASSLVTGFFASQPKYSPDNLDKVIAFYQQFVAAHFVVDDQSPLGNGAGYLLTGRMAALYKLKGNEAGGVVQAFDALERSVADPAGVRYVKALFYGSGFKGGAPASDRAALVQTSNQILQALAAEGSGPYARKALATLASQQFYQRDFALARETYRTYLAAYPKSDWAWVAALRIAQSQMEAGDPASAMASFQQAASTYASVPMARVLGFANAARAGEAAGKFDEALADYRRAVDTWDTDFGLSYAFPSAPAAQPGQQADSSASVVTKEALTGRVALLTRSLAVPGGSLLERGRWQLQQQHWDAARKTFEDAIARYPGSAIVADARALAHRARVERALVLADIEDPTHDEAAALAELKTLSQEPPDFNVSAAAIASAVMLWKQGAGSQAQTLLKEALTGWQAHQPTFPPPARGSVDEDVIAIRDVVFRPAGGGIYGFGGWNAFAWPATPPAFLVVNPDLTVRLPTGEVTRVTSYRPLPGLGNVLFANADQLQFFATMMRRLGGNKKREPTQIMETPNQPIGPSLDILRLLNQFFATRPGHWGGWEFLTYPVISRIEFLNAERTKATAAVTIGYAGATVVLEKRDGTWVATALTNQWVT